MDNYIEVAVVSFNNSKNKYYFLTNNLKLRKNLTVIVNTERGLQFGLVDDIININSNSTKMPTKDIVRIATKKDYNQHLNNLKDAKTAYKKCKELIKENDLQMNLIDASYNFERTQLYFSYVANERVDFRNLAKSLAAIYKVRIELRQVGPRDKAKEIGGIGPCGRQLCCNNYLYSFNNITINMAKNQNISLNPTKINGLCNRLLCCLNNEDEFYKKELEKYPKVGKYISYDDIEGKVISIDVIKKTVRIETKDKEIIEISDYGSNK